MTRLIRGTFVLLWLLPAVLGCRPMPVEEGHDTKGSNFAQTGFSGDNKQDNLMKKLDGGRDSKWVVQVKYPDNLNFTPDERKQIEQTVKEDIDLWLQPLRDQGYDVVKEVKVTSRRLFTGSDLIVQFASSTHQQKASTTAFKKAGILRRVRTMITMRSDRSGLVGDSLIPGTTNFSRNTLRHEIGHAFGLDDTYDVRARKAVGLHPPSIMSSFYNLFNDKSRLASLTQDDIDSLLIHYKVIHEGADPAYACTHNPELVYDDTIDPAGCVPAKPLLYALKYYEDTDDFVIGDFLEDSRVKANDTDDNKNSALHLALTSNKLNMAASLLAHLGSRIDPTIQNNSGNTALHLAAAKGQGNQVAGILNNLLNNPSVNLALTNSSGMTAYDVALDYNDRVSKLSSSQPAFAANNPTFDKTMLQRLNPSR